MSDLRTDHVIAFKNGLVDAGLAPATVGKILGLVKQSLEGAVTGGLLVRNPGQGVSRPSMGGTVAGVRQALAEAEITKLLAAAEGTPFARAIRVALATGVRQSELLALRWQDIDLERQTMTVAQTVQRVGGVFRLLPPKTRNSRRVIELSGATVALLRRHGVEQLEQRLRVQTIWQDHDLILPAADGSPQHRQAFYRDYARIVKAAGLEGVDFHALRHTAASQWIRAGVDIFTVSRRLDHAKTAFTMDVYGHLLEGQQRQAAEALDHLLG